MNAIELVSRSQPRPYSPSADRGCAPHALTISAACASHALSISGICASHALTIKKIKHQATAKIIAIAVLVISLMMLAPTTAKADIPWEPYPYESSFYGYVTEDGKQSLPSIRRTFVSAKDSNVINMYPDPRTSDYQEVVSEEVYIYYYCNYGGEYWGIDTETANWIKLDELLVKYDNTSFREEYSHEFFEDVESYKSLVDKEQVVLWTYPGSGEIAQSYDFTGEDPSRWSASPNSDNTYIDGTGRVWQEFSHFTGKGTYWICLDDPCNKNIEAFYGDKEPFKWSPDVTLSDTKTVAEKDASGFDYKTAWIPIAILVFVLAVGTAIVITLLFRPKKAKGKVQGQMGKAQDQVGKAQGQMGKAQGQVGKAQGQEARDWAPPTIMMLGAVLVTAAAIFAGFCSPTSVYADVVEVIDYSDVPKDEQHKLTRNEFIVYGYDGYITPQLRPGENETIAKLGGNKTNAKPGDNKTDNNSWGYHEGDNLSIVENGNSVFLDRYTEVDGVYWGCTASFHGRNMLVWMPMDQLLVSYTDEDFIEANQDKITEIENPNDYEVDLGAGTVFWEWPGTDRAKNIIEENHGALAYYVIRTYTDEYGNKWGYVHGDTGFQGFWGWVCLDDPKNTEIAAFNPEPIPQRWAPDATYDWTIEQMDYPNPINPLTRTANRVSNNPVLVAIAACGAVFVTAVVVILAARRVKKKQDGLGSGAEEFADGQEPSGAVGLADGQGSSGRENSAADPSDGQWPSDAQGLSAAQNPTGRGYKS